MILHLGYPLTMNLNYFHLSFDLISFYLREKIRWIHLKMMYLKIDSFNLFFKITCYLMTGFTLLIFHLCMPSLDSFAFHYHLQLFLEDFFQPIFYLKFKFYFHFLKIHFSFIHSISCYMH